MKLEKLPWQGQTRFDLTVPAKTRLRFMRKDMLDGRAIFCVVCRRTRLSASRMYAGVRCNFCVICDCIEYTENQDLIAVFGMLKEAA